MKEQDLISVQLLCRRYNVPNSFIIKLQEYQLIEVIVRQDDFFINVKQIKKIEKLMRLHYDLDINLEGVDAIYNLLQQVEDLQEEIKFLKNKLNRYE
ncbi:hypothetical protein E1J38_008580 [Seonamhaeicola sediminis]|uniref:MerR family transcriptional regulator n=1 Tax=Seonamhaeicola sediminis TaxID=2528206 RepID=A0A562YF18_9FLAO|nr:chaperone modulator CbpM [Seonamhaeicola sediminis]TWO32906.1 hypothetical protein E1J38_008580 [Seonamhaeicola sediminis]